jgi:cytoskeletal protein CcmA (bactofilin family)
MKTENGSELNLIAAGTVFEGKLRTPGSIRVDGKIIGEVSATQNIAVGGTGDIEGNVNAKTERHCRRAGKIGVRIESGCPRRYQSREIGY